MPALRGFREQAQRAIQVGFAAAVGAGDQVQARHRHDQVAQRAVIGDGEGGQHAVVS